MNDETRPKMTPEELADAILSGNPPADEVELVSSRLTAADLRGCAADRMYPIYPDARRFLRAGADAMDERDRLAAELARLRAENAELAEALRPFALGTYPGAVMPDDCCLWEIVPGRSDGIISRATVGDRRAAAVLAKRESVA